MLVAAVPLAGAGIITASVVSEARAVAATAAWAEELADDAVALTMLDGALFDEMVWASSVDVAYNLDVPTDLVAAFVGGDPLVVLPRVYALTDGWIDRLGDPGIRRMVDDVRARAGGMHEVIAGYGEVSAVVDATLETTLRDLVAAPSASPRAGDLRAAVGLLDLTISIRSAVGDSFYEYFATVYQLRDRPQDELLRLVASATELRSGLAALSDLARTRPGEMDGEAGPVVDDRRFGDFLGSIDELVETSLATGLPDRGLEMSLATAMSNYEGVSAAFSAALNATEVTGDLLAAASEAMLGAAADVRADSDAAVRRTYLVVGLMALATLAAALIATHMIVRPLRDLRRAADGLGEVALDVVPNGPVEVRAAAHAIVHASTHLDLVTRQAHALAAGDLDADVLDTNAPGRLGAAVQRAVGRLRFALAQQEEYRRRLSHEASHDGLTRIPNRTASMAQLARSLARTTRSGGELAVLFVDLDRFKDVNDLHGHQAGDLVLSTVADRLVMGIREGDHVGRLGGDEFLVVAEPVRGIEDAVELAQRLLDALDEPIEVAGTQLTVGASIGIAVADGSHLTPDELLHDADLAVYRAKEAGRGRLAICDEDLRNELAAAADLALAIRGALDRDEFVVHYQPIVDCRDGELHALEALLRWRRPGIGELVYPGGFIGFAERSDLIVEIDRWVVAAVARQLATWRDDPRYGHVPVAVNVSGRHLGHERFVEHVLDPLRARGIDPSLVIIEVTESAVLDDLGRAAASLEQLRAHGVRIAIDDFGTGYTSLAHLRSLPVDIVKIDRSFTANAPLSEQEASIVKLIIDTGHALGATITAEGVETAIEADRLTDLGSDMLQGYYFARPVLPDQLPGARAPDTRRA